MSGAMLGTGCPYSTTLGQRLGLLPRLGVAGGAMDVGRVKVEVWGDKRLGLARPAGGRRPSIAGFRPRLAWRKAYSHSPMTARASSPTCLLSLQLSTTISFAPLGAPGGGKMARTVKLSKPSCQPKSRTLVIPGLSLAALKEIKGQPASANPF